MQDAQILVVTITLKFLSFSRNISPDHGPGDTGGVRLQEEHAPGSLNGKLVNQED